jgi:outer membrane protein
MQIKKIALITALTVSTSLVSFAEAAECKIAMLDINRIITDSKASGSINNQMKTFSEKYQKVISDRETKLKAQEKKLIDERSSMSQEDFASKTQSFEKDVAGLQQEIMIRNNELNVAAQKAMEQIRQKVVGITKNIAKKKGYTDVLPASIPVYSTSDDITKTVIAVLDKELPSVKVTVQGEKRATETAPAA